jgi:hypothetical protein
MEIEHSANTGGERQGGWVSEVRNDVMKLSTQGIEANYSGCGELRRRARVYRRRSKNKKMEMMAGSGSKR